MAFPCLSLEARSDEMHVGTKSAAGTCMPRLEERVDGDSGEHGPIVKLHDLACRAIYRGSRAPGALDKPGENDNLTKAMGFH